jgi:hypothetical protein
MIKRFLAFSKEITGFTVFQLQGTGMAQAYLDAATSVLGAGLIDELLSAYERVRDEAQGDLEFRLRREIFGDEKLGPIARNIIKMWFVGIWYELPRAWTESFGAREKNVTFMVSATAYTEGLLWTTIGANPSGAKAPGYGSWAEEPDIPKV